MEMNRDEVILYKVDFGQGEIEYPMGVFFQRGFMFELTPYDGQLYEELGGYLMPFSIPSSAFNKSKKITDEDAERITKELRLSLNKTSKQETKEKEINMQNVIHEYIRERVKGKGKQIVGVMAGMVYEGVIVVGWSKANLKAGDVFNKDEGMRIALDRAKGWMNTPATPIQLVEPLRTFQMRCLRYFKQAKSMATGFGGRDNDKSINESNQGKNSDNGVYIHPEMSSDDTLKAMNIVMDMILKEVGLPEQVVSKEFENQYLKEFESLFPRFFR